MLKGKWILLGVLSVLLFCMREYIYIYICISICIKEYKTFLRMNVKIYRIPFPPIYRAYLYMLLYRYMYKIDGEFRTN